MSGIPLLSYPMKLAANYRTTYAAIWCSSLFDYETPGSSRLQPAAPLGAFEPPHGYPFSRA